MFTYGLSAPDAQRQPLPVAVAQPACALRDIAANVRAHAEVVSIARSRVVVFPELSLTGYALDAPAVVPNDPRLTPLVTACAETGSVAFAGAPVAGDGGREYIATLAVDSVGATVVYHKRYPGETEEHRFAAGEAPVVVCVDGWRLGLAVCRDTTVPQHTTDTAAQGIDVYVAATVETPDAAPWQDQRLQQVAVDHGVWVALASAAGVHDDGFAETAGGSAVWDASGTLRAQAGSTSGDTVCVTVE